MNSPPTLIPLFPLCGTPHTTPQAAREVARRKGRLWRGRKCPLGPEGCGKWHVIRTREPDQKRCRSTYAPIGA